MSARVTLVVGHGGHERAPSWRTSPTSSRRRGIDALSSTSARRRHESPRGDVTPDEVAAHHPDGADAVRSDDRGEAVAAMAVALDAPTSRSRSDIAGIIGIGGSGGTALITPAMQALPVGVPKVMVSTVASGNVAPYVGAADIAMMYSVTDVAGLNRISRRRARQRRQRHRRDGGQPGTGQR